VVVNVAEPDALNATVPRMVAPSWKLTVPAGIPLPGATTDTCAVYVTDWLSIEGFAEDLIVVVVEALFTVCVTATEVLPVKLLSPLYTAVME
jgi:hypothetical protein